MPHYVALALLGTVNPALAYTAQDVADSAAISGTVTYAGAAPSPQALEITEDKEFCGKSPILSEELVVSGSKQLANVVVFLKEIDAGKPLVTGPVVLDNTGCRYEPHVLATTVGSEVQVKNSDPILHNTHAKYPKHDAFNYALPKQGQIINGTIKDPGMMRVGCDAGHTWMRAYIAAFEHPYFAVTGLDGSFSLDQVPPGTYTLVFWHEKLGSKYQEVTVTADGVRADQAF